MNAISPYPRIISAIRDQPWLITPSAHSSLVAALEAHVNADFMAASQTAGLFNLAYQPSYDLPQGVALVSASGVVGKRLSNLETACGGMDINALVSSIEQAAFSPGIKTVVIDWNSPGGVVTGVQEAGDAIREISKKRAIISYTENMMCSCAQWLASNSTSIYAAASAQMGAIGVYLMLLDKSAALEADGIKVNPISAGKWKLMGSSHRAATPEEEAMMKEQVVALHEQFKKVVSRGRTVDPNAMEGQVLTGTQALKAGIIDGIYPNLGALIKKLG